MNIEYKSKFREQRKPLPAEKSRIYNPKSLVKVTLEETRRYARGVMKNAYPCAVQGDTNKLASWLMWDRGIAANPVRH